MPRGVSLILLTTLLDGSISAVLHTTMAPSLHRLISSALTSPSFFSPPFLKKSPTETLSASSDCQDDERQTLAKCSVLRRRDVSGIALLALFASRPAPATAFSIGISGPKEWLKEQKRKSFKFLLAPIYASRESLQEAYLILNKDSDYTSKDLEEVQKLSSSAARDCVPLDRNSFVNFQANTGVEVCTFKLVLKNAASLLDDKDPAKLEAEVILNDVIRSFSTLNGLTNEINAQSLSNSRQALVDALMDTVSSLDKFEQGIKDILEV